MGPVTLFLYCLILIYLIHDLDFIPYNIPQNLFKEYQFQNKLTILYT